MSIDTTRPDIAEHEATGNLAYDPVRESLTVLPRIFALPLTLLSGKPHLGQRPLRLTPATHLVCALVSLAAGLTVSAEALGAGGGRLWLLIVGWGMTLHGMRNLRMMIYHQCAHRNMWNRKRTDRLLGRLVAGLLVVQHFDRYSTEHVADHHGVHHMTLRDPTVQAFLVSLRLRPGLTRRQMWRRVITRLASPVFHGRFLYARIRSYLHGAGAGERILFGVWLAGVAAAAWLLHGWTFLAVGWLLPATFFYQISNTLRLCVKHTFPPAGRQAGRGRAYFGSLTNAIFIGEAAPGPEARGARRAAAWLRWWLRLALVHFPARYLVLTGDTVCHDFHHRHPMTREWANYIFARERDAHEPGRGWPPYRAVWGLAPAIGHVFDSLGAADPAEYDPARLAEVSRRELFAAFDD
ncbi:MAG TPA: hypothetical protein VFN97_00855 [Actinospica sp.]|nr:hypothetical protein [Actinospica sp.]